MMIRPQMDWRRLVNHFALRYMCLLRKYGEAPQSDTTTCFIIDDIVLEKSGVRMEGNLMALTLWKRVLTCIERILRILGEVLGITPQHLMAIISGNDKEMSKILVMAEALEKWDDVCGQSA